MDLHCKWCGETKPAEEFIRRDASLPYSQKNVRCCKVCNARRNRERYQDPVIREKQQAANAAWRREHSEQNNKNHELWSARNPQNLQARSRVQYLLRRGYWTKQPCMICGCLDDVQAHHDSYAKPHWETVRWLCPKHHDLWHQHLDPIKRDIVAIPLTMAETLREQAREKVEEIYKLRRELASLKDNAETLELEAWTEVLKVAAEEFPAFVKKLPK